MINQDRLVALFLEMCRVNTPARQEKALVDRIQPKLEALGEALDGLGIGGKKGGS